MRDLDWGGVFEKGSETMKGGAESGGPKELSEEM